MRFSLIKRLLLKKVSVNLQNSVWFHCASVGEFNTALPVIKEVKKRFPVVLTYFSPRAEEYLKKKKEFYDFLHPLPLDIPFLIRKFERMINPRLLIVVEREFWPSLLMFTKTKKILINAYSKGNFLEKFLSPHYDLIITRTEEDKKKFESYGCKKVKVCGNLKLVFEDMGLKNIEIPKDKKIVVAGSTHEGEEEIILKAFKNLKNTRLIIAPRHIRRSNEVLKLAKSFGFKVSLRTKETKGDWEVLIVDTLGELRSFYALSDVSIVGGTFVNIGGHNLLEPAFFKKPVIFGKYTHKVKDLEEILVRYGYGFKVENEEELTITLKKLLTEDFRPLVDLKELSERVKNCYLNEIFSYLQ